MKKAIFSFCFVLACLFSFSQTLRPGSFLGFHMMTTQLQPGVTMEQYAQFYTTKMKPEIEKDFPGMKVILLKAVRGKDSSSLGVIYLMNSDANRSKYFAAEGTMTAAGQAAYAKVADKLGKELATYEVMSDAPDTYTDWIVQ